MADPFCRRPPREMASSSPRARPTRWCGSGMPPPVVSCSGSPRIKGRSRGVAILPDNASVVAAAADGAIRVWKPAAVRIFTGHEGPIHAVAAHPNGNQVITGSADRSVKVFDLNNGNLIRSLAGHTDAVRAVVVSARRDQDCHGGQRSYRPLLERGRRQQRPRSARAARAGAFAGRQQRQQACGRRHGGRLNQGLRSDRDRCRQGRTPDVHSRCWCRADRGRGLPCRAARTLDRMW